MYLTWTLLYGFVGDSVMCLLYLGWFGFCFKLILLLIVIVIVCLISGKYC